MSDNPYPYGPYYTTDLIARPEEEPSPVDPPAAPNVLTVVEDSNATVGAAVFYPDLKVSGAPILETRQIVLTLAAEVTEADAPNPWQELTTMEEILDRPGISSENWRDTPGTYRNIHKWVPTWTPGMRIWVAISCKFEQGS